MIYDIKRWQLALIATLGALTLTNPDRNAYETYAVEQVSTLAKEQCQQAPTNLGALIQLPCRATVEAFKPNIRPLLSATTTRQNLFLVSIYRSNISIPAINFHAEVESTGLFNSFYIYKTHF
jgi:hypothetical protein